MYQVCQLSSIQIDNVLYQSVQCGPNVCANQLHHCICQWLNMYYTYVENSVFLISPYLVCSWREAHLVLIRSHQFIFSPLVTLFRNIFCQHQAYTDSDQTTYPHSSANSVPSPYLAWCQRWNTVFLKAKFICALLRAPNTHLSHRSQ